MADRQVTRRSSATWAAAVAIALAITACGDNYENGAGVYTATPTATAPSTAPSTPAPAATTPTQTTGGEGTEDQEHDALTPAQQRAVHTAATAARRFLAGYLPYSYGQGDADEIRSVARQLRAELAQDPPRVPPALADKARPRVGRLQVSGTDRDRVILLAQVDDGQSRYAILLTVQRRDDQWIVTQVQ